VRREAPLVIHPHERVAAPRVHEEVYRRLLGQSDALGGREDRAVRALQRRGDDGERDGREDPDAGESRQDGYEARLQARFRGEAPRPTDRDV
jgi:hypothetical protein